MTHKGFGLVMALAVLGAPLHVGAQTTNPYEGDRAAIRAGRAIFENRCAECHGADAKGMNGPDLTALWARGVRDERVFQTVRNGVEGSIMPSSSAPDTELWAVVAYLKSLSTVSPFASTAGDSGRGQELFEARCTRCHRVQGRGGALGPNLSLIGRVRSPDALASAIREPSASVAAGYRAVSLVTPEAERVRGVIKGEDAFSIQILDVRGRLQGYWKRDLAELVREDRSLMPVFGPDRLTDAELDDVIAYLGTLR